MTGPELREPLALSPPRPRQRNFGVPAPSQALELRGSPSCPQPLYPELRDPQRPLPGPGTSGPPALPALAQLAGLTLPALHPASVRALGGCGPAAPNPRRRAPRSLAGSGARALRAALRTARAFVCAVAAAARAVSGPIAASPDAAAARPASLGRRGRTAAPPAGGRWGEREKEGREQGGSGEDWGREVKKGAEADRE